MLPTKHAAWLVAFLAVGGHAQAQFKGTAEPVAPMAPTAPLTALDVGAAAAPIASAPSVGPEMLGHRTRHCARDHRSDLGYHTDRCGGRMPRRAGLPTRA